MSHDQPRRFVQGLMSDEDRQSLERRRRRFAGLAATDMMLSFGHPATCNGGNPDASTHHDTEEILVWNADDNLFCLKCGRVQDLSEFDTKETE